LGKSRLSGATERSILDELFSEKRISVVWPEGKRMELVNRSFFCHKNVCE